MDLNILVWVNIFVLCFFSGGIFYFLRKEIELSNYHILIGKILLFALTGYNVLFGAQMLLNSIWEIYWWITLGIFFLMELMVLVMYKLLRRIEKQRKALEIRSGSIWVKLGKFSRLSKEEQKYFSGLQREIENAMKNKIAVTISMCPDSTGEYVFIGVMEVVPLNVKNSKRILHFNKVPIEIVENSQNYYWGYVA